MDHQTVYKAKLSLKSLLYPNNKQQQTKIPNPQLKCDLENIIKVSFHFKGLIFKITRVLSVMVSIYITLPFCRGIVFI